MGSFTRRVRLVVLALAAVAGCAGDTAIVLVIGADDPTIDARSLEVYVGVGAATVPDGADALWWRRAPVEIADGTLAFPDGLGADTFELALSPSASLPLDKELVYAVAARDTAGALVAFAHASGPLRFADGEIRRVPVALAARDDGGVTPTGCAWWNATAAAPPLPAARERAIVPADDADCDAFRAPRDGEATDCNPAVDCDDVNPTINPGRGQDCSDVNVDCCSRTAPDATDADGDGWKVCDGDCLDEGVLRDVFGNDVRARDIHPGQPDATCDGVDQACASDAAATRCDGAVPDPDGDGYVTCHNGSDVAAVRVSGCRTFRDQADCLEAGSVMTAGGQIITAAQVHPEAADVVCDGVDQDCSGKCDDGGAEDGDGDGFDRCVAGGNVDAATITCRASSSPADCDDGNPFAQPLPAIERCDGIDSGCDGIPAPATAGVGPCLPVIAAPGDVCQVGRGACAEIFDGVPRRLCDTSTPLTGPLPPRLCTQCPTGGDPFDCEDGRFTLCAPHTPDGEPGVACVVPLQVTEPLPGCATAAACSWNLLGGTDQDGWTVGLVDPLAASTAPSGERTALATALRVYRVGPSAHTFVLRRTDQAVTDYLFVRMVLPPIDACGLMTCSLSIATGG